MNWGLSNQELQALPVVGIRIERHTDGTTKVWRTVVVRQDAHRTREETIPAKRKFRFAVADARFYARHLEISGMQLLLCRLRICDAKVGLQSVDARARIVVPDAAPAQ